MTKSNKWWYVATVLAVVIPFSMMCWDGIVNGNPYYPFFAGRAQAVQTYKTKPRPAQPQVELSGEALQYAAILDLQNRVRRLERQQRMEQEFLRQQQLRLRIQQTPFTVGH